VGASIVGGQYLFARGLGGRYTNVRLNGVPLPSTDPDLPGFQLDLFPASLLSALTITKTFSPDMPGDFAGGSLNVETRGFPESFKLTTSLSVTYNSETTFRHMPSYAGGALDFLGLDDGKRALPEGLPDTQLSSAGGLSPEELTAASRRFPNTWRLGDRVALPNLSLGLSVGDTLTGRAGRFGYLLTLGYRHKLERYVETTTKAGLTGSGAEQRVVARETLEREVGGREAQIGALGSLYYEPTPEQRLTLVSLLTQNGEDRASLLSGRTETEGTNVRLTQLRFIERRLLFNQLLGEHALSELLRLRWQLNMSRTLREQPDSRGLLYTEGPNGFQFSNTSGSGERLYTDLAQADYGGGLNLSMLLSEQTSIKLGYLGRSGERDFIARRMGVQILGTPSDRLLPAEQLFAPERAGELWRVNEVTRVDDGFNAREDLHAAYAMLEAPTIDGVKLMLGGRIESFHQQIDVVPPFTLVDQAPPGADRTDRDYLPAAAIVVSPAGNMNVRAAYGGTVARPLVRELAPFLSQDFVRRRTVVGNPALQRTFIHNLDLRWELFPSPTEVLAVSGFYKSFEQPIESVVTDTAGNITFDNIDAAESYGAELEARVNLGVIAAAFQRLSAAANLALIRSRVSLSEEQRGTATRSERPLAGQSPYVANLSLGYDSEESGLSSYVYYNVFGRRIQEVGRLGLPDVYEEPFHSLDVTAFWKTKSHLTLGISASNLLFSPVRLSQGGLDFSRSERGSNIGLSLAWAP
jgi:outer membrane receptor protein involved in Fe transport